MADSAAIRDASQFADDAAGWQKRWTVEIDAAKECLKPWHERGIQVIEKFLDKRSGGELTESHVNLFSANTQTTKAFLYGKVPQVDVKRRWGDPNDKAARAAGEMLQRLLNTDIERDTDTFTRALKNCLHDRLLPGMGNLRLRYTADFKTEKVDPKFKTDEEGNQVMDEGGSPIELAGGFDKTTRENEDVCVDYFNWRDQLWNAGCRTCEELRWWGFKTPMTLAGLKDRFREPFEKAYGKDWEKHIESIPLRSSRNRMESANDNQMIKEDPWARADVWEIWDKEHKKVWWVVEGADEILDDQEDPLGLDGFWPFPMPLMANVTNEAFIPTPDYYLAQDLYRELNAVSQRITDLEQAIVVRGAYNANCKEIGTIMSAKPLKLVPVSDWPMFKDKDGLKGQIEWMPLQEIVEALGVLRDYRKELIMLLQQVTGMSDILRGEASQQATATEQAIKAKFASIRLQDFQDEFARFASDVQRIRAEIIVKLFSDEAIMSRSNIAFTADAQYAPIALKILRDKFVWYRIIVKPESVSLTDYAAVQQERTQIMQSVSQMLQVLLPIGQEAPMMLPPLLELVKWMFTGFRGGASAEAILDQAVQKANEMVQQRMSQPPPPDPKLEAAKVKAQAEIQKSQIDVQGTMMDHQTGMQKLQQQHALETQQMQQKHHLEQQKMGMEMQQAGAEHELSMQKTEADIRKTAMEAVAKTIPEAAPAAPRAKAARKGGGKKK